MELSWVSMIVYWLMNDHSVGKMERTIPSRSVSLAEGDGVGLQALVPGGSQVELGFIANGPSKDLLPTNVYVNGN